MCGIVGQFSFDGAPVDPQVLERMNDTIVHRGPDDQGLYLDGPVGLGMRRLSIIDLAGGHQPMFSADGRLAIVFNGEIYNYRELRRDLEARGHVFRTASDTESILHAYDEWGLNCFVRLNGMFGIALWDSRLRQLVVARDRLGIKPLYVSTSDTALVFASELKAVLAHGAVPRELDDDALTYFLRYGYVTAPATLLKHVRKLAPAHYLVVTTRGVTDACYWRLPKDVVVRPASDHAEALYEAVGTAVRRQLVADVPLGAFLSGGLDSSSIVHYMNRDSAGPPTSTYAIGFPPSDAIHDELEDARFVAGHFGTAHHEIVVNPDVADLFPRLVSHLDEPLADSSFVVTYLVSALAKETVKVILSGVGGDELFGGYRRYLGPRLSPAYRRWAPSPVRAGIRALANRLPVDRGSWVANRVRLIRAFANADALPPFESYDHTVRLMDGATLAALRPGLMAEDSTLQSQRRDMFALATGVDPVTAMMALDLQTSLPESLLLLTDRMSMATSIEARVPFLDHEVVELAMTIPGTVKISGTRLRNVQKASMEGKLPERVLMKRKRGFGVPVGAWFRRELRPLVRDSLSVSALRRQGLFSGDAVAGILAAHESRSADYSDALLALVTFQLWASEHLPPKQS